MNLFAVAEGARLIWPKPLLLAYLPVPEENAKKPLAYRKHQWNKLTELAERGGPGYVVDMDAPYEKALIDRHQRKLLVPVAEFYTDGRTRPRSASKIEEAWVLRWISDTYGRDAATRAGGGVEADADVQEPRKGKLAGRLRKKAKTATKSAAADAEDEVIVDGGES